MIAKLEHPTSGTVLSRRRAVGHPGQGARGVPPRGADGVPGPVRVAQPVPHDRAPHRAADPHPQPEALERRGAAARGPAARARAADARREVRRPPAARALGRSASARRDRPGARPGCAVHRGRRAGVDARRVDPARRAEPAGRPAAAGRPRGAVHHARPRDGAALLGRDPRDVPRRHRRARKRGRRHPERAARVHAAAARGRGRPRAARRRCATRCGATTSTARRGRSRHDDHCRPRHAHVDAHAQRPHRLPAAARARPAEPVEAWASSRACRSRPPGR